MKSNHSKTKTVVRVIAFLLIVALIYGALTDMGYACARPDGAFYLFLKSPEPDARAFCRRAMDYDILLVPGDDFGCPGYARLAYCVARSQLERSLPAFRKLAGSYGLTK